MRAASFLVQASLAAVCGLAANCTPRDDLSSFSAGAQATDTRPLETEEQVPPAPPGATDAAPSSSPSEGRDQPGAAAEPAPTMSSDTPPPASDLAGGENSGGGTAPASGAPATSSDPGEPAGSSKPGAAASQDAGATGPQELPGPAPAPGSEATPPPIPETPSPAPEQFRFVRLVADSDVTAGPLTSVAEFDVLGADGQPLDHSGWIASADSAEPTYVGGAPAAMAIDGQPGTMWHTPWFQVVPPPHPHFIQVDLGQPQTLGGFRYLARQDGQPEGRIAAYRFFVSSDGVDWGAPRVQGTLANTDQAQDVSIP